MKNTAILRRNPNIVTRVIEDETILLPIYKSSDEISYIYTLNKVASKVWDLINGKRSLVEIKKEILEKFDTTPEEVDKEMENFLKDLKEIKAINS